jgi:hypothetical protein
MREVSAVWVMGLMASLMNRSDMVGILQVICTLERLKWSLNVILFPRHATRPLPTPHHSTSAAGDFNSDEAPALLRDLSSIIESTPGMDLAGICSKIQLLGWNGVTLDYQSLQLALAWIESEKP